MTAQRDTSTHEMRRRARELRRVQQIAQRHGGECLATEYVTTKTKMAFRCKNGHEWSTIPAVVKRGHWCDECGGTKTLGIEDMHAMAVRNGGRCLSMRYVNNRTKLLWECALGHRFPKKANDVQQGQWCPDCAGNVRHTIEEARELALRRGGKCLSQAYRNNKGSLLWECAAGHKFASTFNRVQRGNWCRKCAGLEKGTIEDMQRVARALGGECLSATYVNSQSPLLWRCKEGHVFQAVPQSVKQGHWCAKCNGNAPGTIDEMKTIATDRGGECLSTRYVDSQTQLRWRCGDGHIWDAKPVEIKQGRWCRECGSSLGERLCRTMLEQLFGQPFPRVRPTWLLSAKGGRMELDGYCEALGIAFEHQGLHHYQAVAYHRDRKQAIEDTRARDQLKLRRCEERGVLLICIPEVPGKLAVSRLRSFVGDELTGRGAELPCDFTTKSVDLSPAYKASSNRAALEEMRQIARSRRGECLSDRYVNAFVPLWWRCAKDHEWPSKPVNVKNAGSWCPVCFNGGTPSPYKVRRGSSEHARGRRSFP